VTKKEYILIAAALKQSHIPNDQAKAWQHATTCRAVAYALQEENPRFNVGTFLKACGVVAA